MEKPAIKRQARQAVAGPEKSGQEGFTLIEVVVAVVILGLAYVAVLQSFSLSLRNILRLDGGRSEIFQEYLGFADELAASEEKEEGLAAKLQAAPLHLEGQKYRVVLVTSENGELMTLKIVRP